jgi:hypothetical protein
MGTVLLAALVVGQVVLPFLAHEGRSGRLASDGLLAVTAAVLFLAVFDDARTRRVAAVLLAPAFVLSFAEYALPPDALALGAAAFHLSAAAFFGFAVAVIVRDVFRHRSIALDDVAEAFAGYLLLGLLWGNLYVTLFLLVPGAFSVSPDIAWQLADSHLRRALFNYFSFTTMASLGYSDVTPTAPITNTLSWMEVLSAQFYLAVVIAQLVGLKLAQAIAQRRENRA